jgi:hypothetical protein
MTMEGKKLKYLLLTVTLSWENTTKSPANDVERSYLHKRL